MSKLEQINETLLHALAEIINREIEIPNVFITATFVKCSADLNNATVGISVLPDHLTGTALEKLRRTSGTIAQNLRKKVKIRRVPKLRFVFDSTERKAAIVEKEIALDEEALKHL